MRSKHSRRSRITALLLCLQKVCGANISWARALGELGHFPRAASLQLIRCLTNDFVNRLTLTKYLDDRLSRYTVDPITGHHSYCPAAARACDAWQKKLVASWKVHPSWTARLHLKLTVIIVPPSLLGQWRDELTKFAPQLKVLVYHNSGDRRAIEEASRRNFDGPFRMGRGKNARMVDIDITAVDVLLGTPQTPIGFLDQNYCIDVHRLIVDEAHLKLPSMSFARRTRRRWLVTGTPFTAACSKLQRQAALLGFWTPPPVSSACQRGTLCLKTLCNQVDGVSLPSRLIDRHDDRASPARVKAYAELVASLRTVMIRHTKAQRIDGGAALALPTLKSETVFLTMSKDEREAYEVMTRVEKTRNNFRVSHNVFCV
jgi:hypothetical protein